MIFPLCMLYKINWQQLVLYPLLAVQNAFTPWHVQRIDKSLAKTCNVNHIWTLYISCVSTGKSYFPPCLLIVHVGTNKHNYEVITANYNCFIIATFTRIRGTANLFYNWPGSLACCSLRPSFYKSVRLCAACIKLLETSALY